MPMKLSLKLMASVCPNRMDTEREFLNHIVDKLNGILLIVMWVDLHCPDPGGIVNRRVLKASYSVALKVPQRDKFDINLNVMARDFFGIASSMDSTTGHIL
jgi:hypothetical protein